MWSVPVAQRGLGRRLDVGGRQPLEVGVAADLGGDDDIVAAGTGRQPLADEGLRLTTLVARDPGAVRVGGVDEVAAGRRVRVEDGEGLLLVGRPAEDVAAEGEGKTWRLEVPSGRRDVIPRDNQLTEAAIPDAW